MRKTPRPVLWIVLACAAAVHAVAFFGSALWAAPDTSYYVELAGGIVERGDFRSPLFLIRPPGYPLMLAGVFAVFGSASSTAILVLQHAMVAAIAALIAAMAWHLTESKGAALAAGILSAAGLQLAAYANIVMTEAPFTLLFILSVYLVVRYGLCGCWGWLVSASAIAGISYLFRPIGMTMVAVCALAVIIRVFSALKGRASASGACVFGVAAGRNENSPPIHRWRKSVLGEPSPVGTIEAQPSLRDLRSGPSVNPALKRWAILKRAYGTLITYRAAPRALSWTVPTGLALAIAPAFIVVAPAMIQNKLIHGGDLSTRCADLALYHRVAYMDTLESANSAAFVDIQHVVAEAIERSFLPAGSDHRLWGQVWKAYESVRGISLTEASAIMGRAARDLIREHPMKTVELSVKYSYWMLMVPDSFYRFHPGGAPRMVTAEGECVRDPQSDILDAATYEPMMRRWTGPCEKYLHLQEASLGPTTPLWTEINRWFYQNIEKGPRILGLTAYEALTWLCLLSAVGCLLTKNRSAWFLIITAIALQIGISAILAGPTPRYAVPVQPLLVLFPAGIAVTVARHVACIATRARGAPEPSIAALVL